MILWTIILVFFIRTLLVDAFVTTLPCTLPASTISLTQVSETFRYPANGTYPKLTICEWSFRSIDPNTTLLFVVSNVSIHCGDTLRFYEGATTSNNTIDNPLCCQTTSCAFPSKTTSGSSLFAKFNTDNFTLTTETGFEITIIVGKDKSSCYTEGTVNDFHLTRAEKVTLTSPKFPQLYPSHSQCTHTYSYETGRVQIEFLFFETEACCDFVDLYDGDSHSPSINRLLGNTLQNSTYTSSNSSMTIKFKSDGSIEKHGFVAIISQLGAETVCQVGYYGPYCDQRCSSHCNVSNACYHGNGTCIGGCADGWTSDRCDQGNPDVAD